MAVFLRSLKESKKNNNGGSKSRNQPRQAKELDKNR